MCVSYKGMDLAYCYVSESWCLVAIFMRNEGTIVAA
jgi:hypothetical protein